MFLHRLDPQAADGLGAPPTAASCISRGSRRTARASAWACAALAVPTTIALILLGCFVATGFWIAALIVASLGIAFVGSTVALLRIDADQVEHVAIPVADADRDAFERMKDLHTAQITGISRSLGRGVGVELEQLLRHIERRWASLAAQQHAAEFEEGRQRADYPWTIEQHAKIAALGARRIELSGRSDELLRISRALPGRVVTLADNPARRVEPAALRLAMIEAQIQVDDVLAAEPAL